MKTFHTRRTVRKVRYDTRVAALIAGDDYRDQGVNMFLWRTPEGHYFVTLQAQDYGMVWLRPLSREKALQLYEGSLSEHRLGFEEAFPDVAAGDA